MYRFKALNPAGETEEGEIDAAVESVAVAQLQDAGYLPIHLEPVGVDRRWSLRRLKITTPHRKISARDMEFFTRELATLLEAGLPLDQSLQTLLEVADSAALKRLITAVDEDVRRGVALSAALADQQFGLSVLFINMVRAGEASGSLDESLSRLADYLQRSRDLRDSITSALIYPIILVIVAGLSVTALLMFVLPQFSQMFADLGAALPWPTQLLLTVGEIVRSYWWVIPSAALAIGFLGRRWLSDPAHRLRVDGLVLQLPLVGELIVKSELAKFTHTLGTMIGHGVPLVRSLEIVRGGMSNRALGQCVVTATEGLQRGQGLATPLGDDGLFPSLAIKLIHIGEESGRLEEMLLRLADIYERDVRTTLQRLLSLLEPTLIVGLGVVIAGIILAILTAVLGMNQTVL